PRRRAPAGRGLPEVDPQGAAGVAGPARAAGRAVVLRAQTGGRVGGEGRGEGAGRQGLEPGGCGGEEGGGGAGGSGRQAEVRRGRSPPQIMIETALSGRHWSQFGQP